MDILGTFCGVFIEKCVKLMPVIFEFWVLLFYCFVYRQNVTNLLSETFYQYGHNAGEVEDNHTQTRSCLINRCAKIRAFSCGMMTVC